jgi:hypothetical protein
MRCTTIAVVLLAAACDAAGSGSGAGGDEPTVLDGGDVRALGTSDVIALVENLRPDSWLRQRRRPGLARP